MRVKRGQVKNRKHKAVLARAKGYRMSYSKLYRRATEALLHAGQYNFAHRRRRHLRPYGHSGAVYCNRRRCGHSRQHRS